MEPAAAHAAAFEPAAVMTTTAGCTAPGMTAASTSTPLGLGFIHQKWQAYQGNG
jgi:hypothetical protein